MSEQFVQEIAMRVFFVKTMSLPWEILHLWRRLVTLLLPIRCRTSIPLAIAAIVGACGGSSSSPSLSLPVSSEAQPPKSSAPKIEILSSRSDTVSGGDVIVAVSSDATSASASAANLTVRLNGVDVSSSLEYDPRENRLAGRIGGLHLGENTISAQEESGPETSLTIKNHPSSGPVVAGPHQTPWICETESSGLGSALDASCNVSSRVDWYYVTGSNTFKPLASLVPPYPADLATTETIDGKKVNFIIRVESGTMDQSIYRIALLDDPTNPISDPWKKSGKKPGAGWNGKLNLVYGGGCSPGYRSGSNALPDALQALPLSTDNAIDPLSLGFAVAFASRMAMDNGCDPVMAAENSMMLKEHFVKNYGVPKFTIGTGPSGGAMIQHFIAQSYPGVLDAITPGLSFADTPSVILDVVDCSLLNRYFDGASPGSWPVSTQAQVAGYPIEDGSTTCRSWDSAGHAFVTPTLGFNPVVPKSLIFDPVTNPSGARGGYVDGLVNVFGLDADTGFARAIYDNIGVQYGLQALNRGDITVDQFLDLNKGVGGFDVNGFPTTRRSAANIKGVENSYKSGLVNSGVGITIPIIDTRLYTEGLNTHTRIRTFTTRSRLQAGNGTVANHVSWLSANVGGYKGAVNLTKMALVAHNEWLERISADTSSDNFANKVIKNKPPALVDTCWDSGGIAHAEPATLELHGVCNTMFPVYSTPRIQAGENVGQDVMKCALKAPELSSYKVPFSPAQWSELQTIFQEGVCDWTKPSVGRLDAVPWQRH
ncbi:DUF6351 family protein [Variovorax sp. E3]|uniref:DUF6351 family protein n=1 Tax=Variovorax sp. E3 TaxID=1914993 RepID=UPI0018DD132D|nr:DUF6351 family protein [Variovorax sp. E3]